MGDAPDHQRLAAEVLGIRGAPPELARRLVAQALVLEDRSEVWRRTGERICRDAPATPGVYVLRTPAAGRCTSARRSTCAVAFARTLPTRRWRAIKPEMARAAGADVARGRLRARGAAARGGADPRAAAARERSDLGARLDDTRGSARARARRHRAGAVGRSRFRRARCGDRRRPVDDSADASQRRRPGRPHPAPDALLQRPAPRPRRGRRRSRRSSSRGCSAAARRRRGSIRATFATRASCARGWQRCSATSGSFTNGWISVSRARDGAGPQTLC